MENEIKLSYLTRDNVDPRGKSRVYFSYHPEDIIYLEHIGNFLLKMQNCAVFYYDYIDQGDPNINELALLLREMQLFVIPVTSNFLFKSCTAYDFELKYALNNNIPILPLLQDSELGVEFNRKCGNLQFLDEYAKDGFAISFEDKLKKYLQAVLISDETIKRIQTAFEAYVFLSYRKKDRKYAQKFISLIHSNPLCRNIAVWYDEFLLPGEPFDKAIEVILEKSDLFVLLVTPNLINEYNYVQSIEFPTAKKAGKEIIAVEAKHTNRSKLKRYFKDIPGVIRISDKRALNRELVSKLKYLSGRKNNTPERNFLIGLAFLAGIDVEYNPNHAVEMITDAASSGLTEAMKKLVDIYYHGIGIDRKLEKVVYWQRKYVDTVQLYAFTGNDVKAMLDLLKSRTELADYLMEADCLKEAENVHLESIRLTEKLSRKDFKTYSQYLSAEYGDMGVFYTEIGRESEAENYFFKALQTNYERLQRDPDADKGQIAVNYNNLGMLFLEKGDFAQASEYLNKSIDSFSDLVVTDADKYSSYFALVCDNLGIVYHHNNNAKKAEEFLGYAIKVREHLVAMNFENFKGDLALSYHNAFVFFADQNSFTTASEYLKKTIAIFEELIQENPEFYKKYLAQCYQNAGLFYKEHGEYATAKKYLFLANEYYEQLACNIPARFEGEQASTLSILGMLYLEMGRLEEAEQYQTKSLEIREHLYKIDSERYATDLAVSYNNIGHLMILSDVEKALDYLMKSVNMFERIMYQHDDKYYEGYSSACNNLGMLYEETGKMKQAELWLRKSLNIRKQMSKMNHFRYDGALAFGYNNMGTIFFEQDDLEKAFSNFESAISIYEKIAEAEPKCYRNELAACYMNAYACESIMGGKEESLRYLMSAVSEYEALEQNTPGIYAEDLSICYNNIGMIYEDKEEFEKAERYYLLSVELLAKYSSKETAFAYGLSVEPENLGMLHKKAGHLKKRWCIIKRLFK